MSTAGSNLKDIGSPPLISVTIATYDRCKSLAATLDSFVRQTMPSSCYEIIVIDNNCTDQTADVVASFAGQLPIRYFRESRQGLSHCRNRAIAEFRGEVLLFTDDDVILEPDWLAAYSAAIAANPDTAIFGGRIKPMYDVGRPGWLRNEALPLLSGVIGSLDHGTRCRPMSGNEMGPFGASFAVRRALLDRIGGFRLDLGRSGTTLGRGEETDFFQRAQRLGLQRIYVGTAMCWHRVPPERLRLRQLFAHGMQSGKAHALLTEGLSSPPLYGAGLYLLRGCCQLVIGRGDRFRQCVINAGIVVGLRRQLSGTPPRRHVRIGT